MHSEQSVVCVYQLSTGFPLCNTQIWRAETDPAKATLSLSTRTNSVWRKHQRRTSACLLVCLSTCLPAFCLPACLPVCLSVSGFALTFCSTVEEKHRENIEMEVQQVKTLESEGTTAQTASLKHVQRSGDVGECLIF